MKKVGNAKGKAERVVVAIGGESGAGKTEIAEYLRYLVRRQKMWGVTTSGDAFFKLPPAENHKSRLEAYAHGRLEQYLGPEEVNLAVLDSILGHACNKNVTEISIPSDCRRLGTKRYEMFPLTLPVPILFLSILPMAYC